MNYIDKFYEAIKSEETVTLATCADGIVTMRVISPVDFRGDILFFTDNNSMKYKQLKENPNCCIAAGGFFAQAKAEFFGATMLDENVAMREAYTAKFTGAFDEGMEYGGRSADFVLLHPEKLSGWGFANDIPTADGIPNIPFEITFGQ